MHRPKVGERIMLEVLPPGESYPSEVQAVDDSTMRVAPAMRVPDLPEPGTAVRIMFVRKDGIYEEQGTVAEVASEPDVLVTIRLAGEIARTQRRDFVRKDASLNVDLTIRDQSYHGVTKDVSGGGVSVLFSDVPPVVEGEEFDVLLNVPDGRLPIRAHSRVRYVREILRGSRWLVGSQFTIIADEDRQRLVRFVFRLDLAQKRPVGKR
jgi:c-di-GMP-binding flagellar brake protein YcgR